MPDRHTDFEEIIHKDYLYIDKTEYVYRMAHGASKYCFLSRPRQFGKSLLTSTLHSYFSGKKELFKGLVIEKLEKEWTEYPVLHFDMSLAKHVDKDTLESMLSFQLSRYEQIYGKPEEAVKLNDRMTSLIMRAYGQTGRQVVVLIDEYDAPLLDVMHEEENLPVLRNVMRNFYSPLKACDPYLRFVFLTGITKFSQLSIFSELNNIKNISMDDPYAAVCGITKEEMLEQMAGYIERLAVALEMSKEETLQKLKEKYDGYHFTWPSPDILDVEVRTPKGRVDVVMRTADTLYVIELKLGKSADAAMSQINLKNYPERFILSGLPIVKVGINFDPEKHTLGDWLIEE